MPQKLAAALAVTFLGLCSQLCHAELVMVYSIQRHGARNVLSKSSLLAESEATGGPTLLPQGQRQCYEAGLSFAKRYINPDSCSATNTCLPAPGTGTQYGVLGTPGVGFSNYNTFANTSALDRTIMSADSFLGGVFPPTNNVTQNTFLPSGQQLVPVYSAADVEDWRIRGYTKCPEYQQRLQRWLSGDEFKRKEDQTAAFRSYVQQLASQLNVSLSNWWNVYDAFNVWRNYQVGDAMPDIDEDTFSQIVEVAMWLETAKMRPELTGNLLGGGLLGDVIIRLTAAQAARATGSQGHYRLLTVSSHYNAQLGLLSALQTANKPTSYPWQTKIPALASVLAIELHYDPQSASTSNVQKPSEGFAVRAVYQDGPKAQYAVLPLPCAQSGDAAESFVGKGGCSFESFMALAEPRAFYQPGDWCEACGNDDVLACKVSVLERRLTEAGLPVAGSSGAPANVQHSTAGAVVALWVLVSVIAASLVAAAAVFGVKRYRRRASGLHNKDAALHAGAAGIDSRTDII